MFPWQAPPTASPFVSPQSPRSAGKEQTLNKHLLIESKLQFCLRPSGKPSGKEIHPHTVRRCTDYLETNRGPPRLRDGVSQKPHGSGLMRPLGQLWDAHPLSSAPPVRAPRIVTGYSPAPRFMTWPNTENTLHENLWTNERNGGRRSSPPPQCARRVCGPWKGSCAGRSGQGGIHDEFSSELRELGWWALSGGAWGLGADVGFLEATGDPGGGDPRGRAPGERGEAQLRFCSRGGSEAAGGVREGTVEGRRPRRGKRGLHERLPHRAARRDAHTVWCHVDGTASSPGAPSSLEAAPGTVRTAQFPQRRRPEHAPISQPFLGCPLPRPDPCPWPWV